MGAMLVGILEVHEQASDSMSVRKHLKVFGVHRERLKCCNVSLVALEIVQF